MIRESENRCQLPSEFRELGEVLGSHPLVKSAPTRADRSGREVEHPDAGPVPGLGLDGGDACPIQALGAGHGQMVGVAPAQRPLVARGCQDGGEIERMKNHLVEHAEVAGEPGAYPVRFGECGQRDVDAPGPGLGGLVQKAGGQDVA